jgi:hypothetical protein
MSSSFWSRLTGFSRVAETILSRVGVVQRTRAAAADGIRQVVPGVREGFALYFGLLVLLGMVTAGFVLLPVGLVLLLQGLLPNLSAQYVVGGVALSLVGLFYLVGPLLLIQVASRLVLTRLQRRVDLLADRVEGRR